MIPIIQGLFLLSTFITGACITLLALNDVISDNIYKLCIKWIIIICIIQIILIPFGFILEIILIGKQLN